MEEICLILIVFKRLLWSTATGGGGRDPWEDLDDSQMNFYEQILCFYLLCLLRPRSRKVQIASCAVRQVSQVSFNKSLPAHSSYFLFVIGALNLSCQRHPPGLRLKYEYSCRLTDLTADVCFWPGSSVLLLLSPSLPSSARLNKNKIGCRDAEKYFTAPGNLHKVSHLLK